MDLSQDDLRTIEHALTRQRWAGVNVDDLLTRVRIEMGIPHAPITDAPDERTFRVTAPKPKGEGWPDLKAASDAAQ